MKERDLLANIQYENMQVCLPHSRVELSVLVLFRHVCKILVFTLLKKLLGVWGIKLEHIVVEKSKQLNSYTYTANVLTIKTTGTGNCGVPAGKICTIYGKGL